MMFQDPYSSLDPRMRVGGILREPLVIQSVGTSRERTEKVAAQLREVGLPGRALNLYPHEFSGGQRQRIGLARALMLEPQLLIADEPVSALDVSIRAQILNLMQTLQAEHGLAYLLISHDLGVIRQMANRIGVMYLGKMVEIGPAESVYTAPAHPYTAGLIDTASVADPRRERARTRTPVRGELPSAFDPPSGCRFRTRCAFAQDVCATDEPTMRSFGVGHSAACHFPLQEPVDAGEVTVKVAREPVNADKAGLRHRVLREYMMFNFDADRYRAIQAGAARVAQDLGPVVADRLAAGCENVIFAGSGGAGILMEPAAGLIAARSRLGARVIRPAELMAVGSPLLGAVVAGGGTVAVRHDEGEHRGDQVRAGGRCLRSRSCR